MKRLGALFGLVLFAPLVFSPARAGLTMCNRTSYVLYAAAAAVTVPDVTVKGWTRLAPGACAEAIKGDLAAQQYFLYAKTSRAHSGSPRAWSGPTNICVKDTDFSRTVPFAARCTGDFFAAGFAPIDTKRMRQWTATFREAPDLASMAAAERAGLKRLLADSGGRNLDDDKRLDAALAAFKTRLKLTKSAPPAALFDALETAAMKSAVPAGYTLCNDTAAPVYAAIGQQLGGRVLAARGWWTVAGGTCAPLITEPVAGKTIWLRVERAKGAALVAGPAKFCVTNIEFEIQGRERCAARGLTEAGFAATHGGPAPGFTAHVTATGLSGK